MSSRRDAPGVGEDLAEQVPLEAAPPPPEDEDDDRDPGQPRPDHGTGEDRPDDVDDDPSADGEADAGGDERDDTARD